MSKFIPDVENSSSSMAPIPSSLPLEAHPCPPVLFPVCSKSSSSSAPLVPPKRLALHARSSNSSAVSKAQSSGLLTFSPPKFAQQQQQTSDSAASSGAKGLAFTFEAAAQPQTLLLAKFQEALWLDFGSSNVVGLPRTMSFLMSSPDTSTLVELVKVPYKKGFSLDLEGEATTVDKGTTKQVVVTWTPTEAGGVREIMTLKLAGKGTATVILHGKAEEKILCSQPKRQQSANANANKPPVQGVNPTNRPLKSIPTAPNSVPLPSSAIAATTSNPSKPSVVPAPAPLPPSAPALPQPKREAAPDTAKSERTSAERCEKEGDKDGRDEGGGRKGGGGGGHTKADSKIEVKLEVKENIASKVPSQAAHKTTTVVATPKTQTTGPSTSSVVVAPPVSVVAPSSSSSSSSLSGPRSKQLLYDDQWIAKQQHAFTEWLNYTFVPTEDMAHEDDIAELMKANEGARNRGSNCKAMQSSDAGDDDEAPSSSAAAAATAAAQSAIARSALRTLILHRRSAAARNAACSLYGSAEFLQLRYNLEEEIEEGRLGVRRDRDMYADLGLRSQIVGLLMSYSSEWLKLGLETVIGEVIGHDGAIANGGTGRAKKDDCNANYCEKGNANAKNETNDEEEEEHDADAAAKTAAGTGSETPLTSVQQLRGVSLPLRKVRPARPPVKGVLSRSQLHLKKFVVDRVLGDPALLAKYTRGKCLVPSGNFDVRYKDDLRKKAIRRVILLVAFLDNARVRGCILDKTPCLFKKDGEVKSTKDLLVQLCRDFMSGEGDFIKHLSQMGLRISYEQKYIDEYDFRVTNLSSDLRDGVRLVRMAEILLNDTSRSLSSSLRVPAVSRLQKLHNVGVALSALEKAGVKIGNHFTAKDVVDGNSAGVLQLLWRTIVHFKLGQLINKELLEQEIKDVKRASKRRSVFGEKRFVPKKQKEDDVASEKEIELTTLLLRWCQEVCATFGLEVNDFTTSFADGRALCLLVHYYHPAILARKDISPTTADLSCGALASSSSSSSHTQEQYNDAVRNEQKNVRLAKKRMAELGGIPGMLGDFDSTAIPEEKSMIGCIAYLCSRLIESSAEIQATLVIQSAFRKWWGVKLLMKKKVQALVIWRFWMSRKVGLWDRRNKKIGGAVAKIEKFILHTKKRRTEVKIARLQREKWIKASVLIAGAVRIFLAKKQLALLRMEFAAFQDYAATIVQSFGRMIIAKRLLFSLAEEKVAVEENAALMIQSQWRRFSVQQSFALAKVALTEIQSAARMFVESRRFAKKKMSAIMIQSVARMVAVKDAIAIKMYAATTIQKIFRRTMAQIEATMMMLSVLKIQSVARGFLGRKMAKKRLFEVEESAKEEFERQLRWIAVGKIQAAARRLLGLKRFGTLKSAAITIQSFARGFKARGELVFANFAAAEIQRVWRGARDLRSFAIAISSAIKIQSFARKAQALDNFVVGKFAAVVLQKAVRRMRARHNEKKLKATVVVQSVLRMVRAKLTLKIMKCYKNEVCTAATCVSKAWRKASARTHFLRAVSAVAKIQSVARGKAATSAYKKTIVAATRVQGFARGIVARNRVALAHFAATEIQRMWRGAQQQVNFIVSVLSAIKIQSCVRMIEAHSIVRRMRLVKKEIESVTKIQRFVRMVQAMDNFVVTKFAAVVIQKMVRRMRVRAKVGIQRLAATVISKAWRKASARTHFLRAVSAVAKIQSVARGKAATSAYKKTIVAATRVQGFARGIVARNRVALAHFAATEIQRMWRGAQQQVNFIVSVLSAIKIQSICRRFMVWRTLAIGNFAATTIQKMVRSMIGRKIATGRKIELTMGQAARLARRNAAKKIVSAAKEMLRFNKMKRCAGFMQRCLRGHAGRMIAKQRFTLVLRLQSLWRGRKARILTNKKMRVIRMKVALANQKAALQPELRLGFRTQKALELLLTSKRLAEIMRATCTLEITSRFSEKCCEAFAAAGAPKVLFTLIRTCNRSLPHIELLQYALMTIKNVARWDHVVDSVGTDESVDVLVDLMQSFRDKETILILCGEILFRVCSNVEKCRHKISVEDNAKRLKGILSICSKKAAIKKVEVKKVGVKASGAQQGICVLESLFQFI